MITVFMLSFVGLFFGMALIKFGGGVAAISGKVGGTVFARNKAGAYSRNWAKPTSTPTPKQTANRARFGNQSAGWGALSSAERDAWNAAAPGTQLLNRLGDPYVPTGRQLFLGSNNQLAASGEPTIAAVPPDFVPPEIFADIFAPTHAVTAGVVTALTIKNSVTDATLVYTVEATGQMPNIKQNLTNVYRQIGNYAAGGADLNVLADWIALYGSGGVVGNVIWFRVKTVSNVNGMASSPVIFFATLT